MNETSIRLPLILIAVFFLTMFIIIFLFVTAEPSPESSVVAPVVATSSTVLETPATTTIDKFSAKLPISTKIGTKANVRNFLADSDVKLIDPGAGVYLLDEENGVNGPIFEIFYYAGGGIGISLLDENLSFARGRAEEALLARIQLDRVAMCSLLIRVNTPRSYSEEYSGRELGLSYCPGSIDFNEKLKN